MTTLKKKNQGEEDVSPTEVSGGTGFASRVRKALGQNRSPNKKRRKTSLSGLGITDQSVTFGMPLDKLIAQRNSPTMHSTEVVTSSLSEEANGHDEEVPLIVSRTVHHVEKNGLSCEGIYRINGNSKVMEKIKAEFDRFGNANLDNSDIYSVAGILKLFLRELPDPLIPDDMIPDFVQLQEDFPGNLTEKAINILRQLLARLPHVNYNLLSFLCRHLLLVSTFSSQNKMTVVSLSIVFGPNIFRCGGGMTGLKLQGHTNSVLAQMIRYYNEVFEECSGVPRVGSDVSDDVFGAATSEATRDKLRERRKDWRREKPVKIRPYSEQIEEANTADNQTQVPGSTHQLKDKNAGGASSNLLMQKRRASSSQNIPSSVDGAHRLSPDLRLRIREDEGLQVQRTPSPYSWQSSPGTSPPTSPALTPRSSHAYSNLISDSVQHNLFQSPTLTCPPHTTPATSTPSSSSRQPDSLAGSQASLSRQPDSLAGSQASSSRQPDSLVSTQEIHGVQSSETTLTMKQPLKAVKSSDSTGQQGVPAEDDVFVSSSEGVVNETGGVRLRGRARRQAKSYRQSSVYDGVLSSLDTTSKENVKDISLQASSLDSGTSESQSAPTVVKQERLTQLVSQFDTPQDVKSTAMRERSFSAHPDLGRKGVRHIADAFEKSDKFIMPFVGQVGSTHPFKKSLHPTSLKKDAASSSSEPVMMEGKSPQGNKRRSPPPIPARPASLPSYAQVNLHSEVRESSTFPQSNKVSSRKSNREPLDLSECTDSSEVDFNPSTSPPKPKTPLPVVLPQPLLTQNKEQTISQNEESRVQANANHELDYVLRRAGTLYHPTLRRVAGPSNRRKPARKPSLSNANNPTQQSVEQPDHPHTSKTTELMQHSASSPRANRERRKIKHLIKTANGLSPSSSASVTSSDTISIQDKQAVLGEKVNGTVPSTKASEKDISLDSSVSGQMSQSQSQSADKIAPEHTHTVQKGWEDKEALKTDKETKKSEDSKQARRGSTGSKIKDHNKSVVDKNARKSVSADAVPVRPLSQDSPALKKKKSPKDGSEKLNETVPAATSTTSTVQTKRLASASLGSLDDQLFPRASAESSIQRHRSMDLLQVQPVVHATGRRGSQGEARTEPIVMTAIVEKIETRLREKRTAAGRPHDLREMTTDELEDEKHCIQKALLQFEKKFGRPENRENKAVMRPIYTRYRTLKQLLTHRDAKAHTTHEGFGSSTTDTLPAVTMMNLSMQQLPSASSKKEAPTKKIYSRVAKKICEDLRKREWMTREEISKATRSELAEEMALATERKKELKELLRKFESQIEGVHGRTCTREDKRLMYTDYQEYKNLRSRIHMLETALKKFPPQDTV